MRSLSLFGVRLLLSIAAIAGSASGAFADVWGLKSHDPVSDPPTYLYAFEEDRSAFASVGQVLLGGAGVDADALAVSASGELFALQVAGGSWSRLLTIDAGTAAATVIGPALNGRDIRGAAFDASGRLLLLDAATDELLEASPATGLVHSPKALTLGSQPYDLTNLSDLTQRPDGSFVVADVGKFYALDPATGALTLLYEDTVPGPDGYTAGVVGLAASAEPQAASLLFAYDVQIDDDVFSYEPDSAWHREMLFPNILSSFNAGRGDLGAPPVPEPCAVALLAWGSLAVLRRRR